MTHTNGSNTMNHNEFEAALPDLLDPSPDRSLDASTRERMDAHLLNCADCSALLADLKQIRTDAGKLPLLTPSHDLWGGIESRIEAPIVKLPVYTDAQMAPRVDANIAAGSEIVVMPAAPRQVSVLRRKPRWQLAAAAILMAATAGITWGVTWSVAQRPLEFSAAQLADTGFAAAMANTQNVKNASRPALNQTYEGEISTLRTLVDARRAELDSATVAVIEKNLKLIDDAIAESKAALAKSPASAFLLERLTDAYDSKLRTLRAIAAMPQRG